MLTHPMTSLILSKMAMMESDKCASPGNEAREGSLIERTSLRPYLVVFVTSAGVLNICKAKNVLFLVQNEERMCGMHSFQLAVCLLQEFITVRVCNSHMVSIPAM